MDVGRGVVQGRRPDQLETTGAALRTAAVRAVGVGHVRGRGRRQEVGRAGG